MFHYRSPKDHVKDKDKDKPWEHLQLEATVQPPLKQGGCSCDKQTDQT